MPDIFVFGATGYLGSAFCKELSKRNLPFVMVRHTDQNIELAFKVHRPKLVINAAGFTGIPNVDQCEHPFMHGLVTEANVVFPANLLRLCQTYNSTLAHISSGCIYNGSVPGGYTEEDRPNFCFNSPPCSFYSGTKALAESILRPYNCYIWRLRMPFDEFDHPKNLLTKLLTYPKIYSSGANSISHLGDCVSACLDLWKMCAPFGIYNVVNPGPVSNRDTVAMMYGYGQWNRDWEFFAEGEFKSEAPRSTTILNTDKLEEFVFMRMAEQAVIDSIYKWQPSLKSTESPATKSVLAG